MYILICAYYSKFSQLSAVEHTHCKAEACLSQFSENFVNLDLAAFACKRLIMLPIATCYNSLSCNRDGASSNAIHSIMSPIMVVNRRPETKT